MQYIFFKKLTLSITEETQDESSSSSDATPTSMSRKSKPPYGNRKAAKTGTTSKRHIRSSSGYSSNHDETTFR